MVTLEQFVSKYLGQTKGYPTDEYYKGQCLSIVKLYIKECFGIDPPPSGTNSAYGYWSNFPSPLGTVFEKVVNTDELIPEPGWIAVWQPWSSNQFGHISIVADGCTAGTLKNYAQNWTSKVFQLESNRYTNVVGFLKPINTMTQDEQNALDALRRYKEEANHGNLEGAVNSAIGAAKDLPNVVKELEDLKTSHISLEARVSELEAKLEESQKNEANWQKEAESANKTLSKKNEEIEVLDNERKQYKAWYEAALKKTADKLSPLELVKLFIQKLFKR
jgi:hypothetical protein